jgi:hypothetical protein
VIPELFATRSTTSPGSSLILERLCPDAVLVCDQLCDSSIRCCQKAHQIALHLVRHSAAAVILFEAQAAIITGPHNVQSFACPHGRNQRHHPPLYFSHDMTAIYRRCSDAGLELPSHRSARDRLRPRDCSIQSSSNEVGRGKPEPVRTRCQMHVQSDMVQRIIQGMYKLLPLTRRPSGTRIASNQVEGYIP